MSTPIAIQFWLVLKQGCQLLLRLLVLLQHLIEIGANDVYVVSTEAHTEVLLPAIHDCILDVDTENMKMTVHLMDGLI